jgi:carboxypeptidase Taq
MALRQSAAFMMVRSAGAVARTASSSSSSSTTQRMASAAATGAATVEATATATASTPRQLQESSVAYKELLEKLQQITHLQHSQAVLNYDQLVFMPQSDRASAARGAQLGALASIIHEKSTASTLKDLICAAEQDLSEHSDSSEHSYKEERILLALAREEYERTERIPVQLEAKRAMLSSTAYSAWVKARAANDFQQFCPTLTDCFETAKETARAVRGSGTTSTDTDTGDGEKSLYSVMLDEFERGMPTERIDSIFQEIETALVPLLTRVLRSTDKPSISCLTPSSTTGTFDLDKQQELSRNIVKALGFDEDHGRIDVSVHPFTTSFSPADVRITSRFLEKEWYQGLAGSIHEAGHAMYEQNLGDSGTAVDTFLSMGCHESQSLFWERHVSLSKPFWKWAAPLVKKAFGNDVNVNVDPAALYAAVNAVKPGLIRVTADELTYPLHVILRYKIERDVVEGKLAVSEIPATWNESMKSMLDVTVPSDADGCLQDVHWSGLAIGYFPTYLLGSATAAQLAHYCKLDIPDFDAKIEKGEFAEIKQWLTDKVHRHGRRYPSLDALLEDQLGEKLNPKYFIDYLTEKYTELYKC